MIYYSTFIVVFQFGWASTQISHLAAIPDLSECQNERTGLTAIRFAMTVISTILVRKNKVYLTQENPRCKRILPFRNVFKQRVMHV